MLMDNGKVEMRGVPSGQECQTGAGYPKWHFTIRLVPNLSVLGERWFHQQHCLGSILDLGRELEHHRSHITLVSLLPEGMLGGLASQHPNEYTLSPVLGYRRCFLALTLCTVLSKLHFDSSGSLLFISRSVFSRVVLKCSYSTGLDGTTVPDEATELSCCNQLQRTQGISAVVVQRASLPVSWFSSLSLLLKKLCNY